MVSAVGGVSPYMVVVNDMDTTSFTSDVTLMLLGGTEMIDVYDAHMCLVSSEEDIDYVNSMDTTFYVHTGDSADLAICSGNVRYNVSRWFIFFLLRFE